MQAFIASVVESRFQFERVGYFCLDPDSTPDSIPCRLVFNRTLPLKDS
jgi:glutaminyl-tRNA synthetase